MTDQCFPHRGLLSSNETWSGSDWESGEIITPVSGRAYAEVPDPNGEHKLCWPAKALGMQTGQVHLSIST